MYDCSVWYVKTFQVSYSFSDVFCVFIFLLLISFTPFYHHYEQYIHIRYCDPSVKKVTLYKWNAMCKPDFRESENIDCGLLVISVSEETEICNEVLFANFCRKNGENQLMTCLSINWSLQNVTCSLLLEGSSLFFLTV